MKNIFKTLLIWIAIFGSIFLGFGMYYNSQLEGTKENITLSHFVQKLEAGEVKNVVIRGYKVAGQFADGKYFSTCTHPQYTGLVNKILATNTNVKIVPPEDGMSQFISILLSWLPMLLIVGWWMLSMRKMNGGGGNAFGFGKSKAKLMIADTGTTFKDVAGIDECKSELEEIVDFLKNPDRFSKIGAKIPKGVLLIGLPGTGKTLLAKAIAGEAGVPFFSVSGSDFVEMFVGVGASRVRDMFAEAKKNAPCIIFMDEIDAVGRQRGSGMGGGNDEREQTLNQILVELDGFESNTGVVLIGATNRLDVLDAALLRPGRFDRKVQVSLPDKEGRRKILLVHMRKVQLGKDVEPAELARGTPGFSGADLSNVVNEAAIAAVRDNRKTITMKYFKEAIDRHILGKEMRSMLVSEKEKSIIAHHESGHAIAAYFCPNLENPYKATIIPRTSGALGFVARLPSEDMHNTTKNRMIEGIIVALAGRVAEELIFGVDDVTTGAGSDMQSAYGIATAMVTTCGMSNLGMIYINYEDVAYGKSSVSEDSKQKIDAEISRIISECKVKTVNLLTQHLNALKSLAQALLTHETLHAAEIAEVITTGQLDKKDELSEALEDEYHKINLISNDQTNVISNDTNINEVERVKSNSNTNITDVEVTDMCEMIKNESEAVDFNTNKKQNETKNHLKNIVTDSQNETAIKDESKDSKENKNDAQSKKE
jgi:cell division protease FtsH